MYNVLIVDEEEHLLWALEKNLFPDRDDISIRTASNGEEGLDALKDATVDLLISDIKMPGKIDGFQLILRAKEVAPDSRVIIMTAFGTNRIQNFADRIGVTHYIEKPFNVSELRDAILEILDEKEGFQGVLSDLELTDIIQMLCLAKRTALLHLKHREHRGKIIFDKGEVVHSEFDGSKGDDAVFRMLALRQGDIFMQSDFQNDEQTVTLSWQDLLFEGLRRADEGRAHPDEMDDDTDLGMGVSRSEVDEIVAEASVGFGGDEPSLPFFSDAELEEIERVSEPPVEFEEDDSFDMISEEVVAAALDDNHQFSREHSATSFHPMPTIIAEEEADDDEFGSDDIVEFRAPFRRPEDLDTVMVDLDGLEDGFQARLDEFARECPGLRMTGIFSPAEGMALNFVKLDGAYEADAVAAFFGDVVDAANRTVRAINNSDRLKEMQLSLSEELIVLRAIESTPYIHIAVVDQGTSLGVALVLMRRFQKNLRASLKG